MEQQARDELQIEGTVIVEIHDAATGRLKSCDVLKNLFVTAGKRSVAQALRGNVANNKGQITYCAVGTGTNSPTTNDTALQTELYRKQVSVREADGQTAVFKTFFNTSEAVGALKEAGLFGDDASSTPGSGTLFARLNINRTKSAADTLTITWMIGVGV